MKIDVNPKFNPHTKSIDLLVYQSSTELLVCKTFLHVMIPFFNRYVVFCDYYWASSIGPYHDKALAKQNDSRLQYVF
jgi:hypothetical protein